MTNPKDCPVSDAMIRAGRVAAMAHRLGGPNDDAMTAIYLAMHRASPGGDEVVKAVKAFRNADIEYRRAKNADEQPRLNRAGTRYACAKFKMFTALEAALVSAGIQDERYD
jgi:hypothetical protein